MAQEIIQKHEYNQINDMNSKDILNIDPCLVKIRQFKHFLKEKESEGLAELFNLLDEILLLAEQHLDQALGVIY